MNKLPATSQDIFASFVLPLFAARNAPDAFIPSEAVPDIESLADAMAGFMMAHRTPCTCQHQVNGQRVLKARLVSWHCEQDLRRTGVFPPREKQRDDEDGQRPGAPSPVVEAYAKAEERFYKAMDKFIDECLKCGAPTDAGLPDVMKPLIEAASEVMEDALAFEAKKPRKPDLATSARPETSRTAS